jgi:hypothetical protein
MVQKIQAVTREKLLEMTDPSPTPNKPRKSPRPTEEGAQAVIASKLL